MPDVIKFRCPKCGSESGLLRVTADPDDPNAKDKLAGAVCASCRHPVSDEDIKAQALDIIRQLIPDPDGKTS